MTAQTKKKTTTKRKAPVKRVKLPPNPFIHEIFDLASEQRTKAKRVEILKEYRDDSVTAVLIWNFDPSVVSALHEGDVPYKPNEVPEGTDHTSLRREWKNLYHFIKGGNDGSSYFLKTSIFLVFALCLDARSRTSNAKGFGAN